MLSSPLANLLKAWASEGRLSDITTGVPGVSGMVVTGLPSVLTEASPVRAEFWVRRGGMTIQGVSLNILLSVGIELKGTRGASKKDWQLTLMGSFDVRQGVRQLQTWWLRSSGDDADGQTWLQLMCCAPWIVWSWISRCMAEVK